MKIAVARISTSSLYSFFSLKILTILLMFTLISEALTVNPSSNLVFTCGNLLFWIALAIRSRYSKIKSILICSLMTEPKFFLIFLSVRLFRIVGPLTPTRFKTWTCSFLRRTITKGSLSARRVGSRIPHERWRDNVDW